MRSRFNSLSLAGAILIALLAMRAAPAWGGPPPHQTGSYTLTFAGHFAGTGNGAVGAQSVTINARVHDVEGNEVHIVIPNIRIQDSRFSGTFTVGGASMVLQGRLEAAGGALRANRMVVTYQYREDGYGRIVGESKKGN